MVDIHPITGRLRVLNLSVVILICGLVLGVPGNITSRRHLLRLGGPVTPFASSADPVVLIGKLTERFGRISCSKEIAAQVPVSYR